ncbi:uncharacterized protein G2W53_027103 [Senna tora]|uniref:Uncharacterized protein n=1 Tax=Senna tora TaxID=362788 RepID=A0A834TGI2_9FABA|nr:uncharacterized protein G2W53_027103 [Senna tora]
MAIHVVFHRRISRAQVGLL